MRSLTGKLTVLVLSYQRRKEKGGSGKLRDRVFFSPLWKGFSKSCEFCVSPVLLWEACEVSEKPEVENSQELFKIEGFRS